MTSKLSDEAWELLKYLFQGEEGGKTPYFVDGAVRYQWAEGRQGVEELIAAGILERMFVYRLRRSIVFALGQRLERYNVLDSQEQKENALIIDLCRECGDQGTDTDLISGFRENHPDTTIREAANGSVTAFAELRRGCCLPLF